MGCQQQLKNNCIDYVQISATVICIMFIFFNYNINCSETVIKLNLFIP